jgi:hypothetical protein
LKKPLKPGNFPDHHANAVRWRVCAALLDLHRVIATTFLRVWGNGA